MVDHTIDTCNAKDLRCVRPCAVWRRCQGENSRWDHLLEEIKIQRSAGNASFNENAATELLEELRQAEREWEKKYATNISSGKLFIPQVAPAYFYRDQARMIMGTNLDQAIADLTEALALAKLRASAATELKDSFEAKRVTILRVRALCFEKLFLSNGSVSHLDCAIEDLRGCCAAVRSADDATKTVLLESEGMPALALSEYSHILS